MERVQKKSIQKRIAKKGTIKVTKRRNHIRYSKVAKFNDFSMINDLADHYLDTSIKFAGEHNILTFNDGYIKNLKRFAY